MLVAGGVSTLSAVPVLSLSDTIDAPGSVTIIPGESFSIDVTLDIDQPFTGISYFLAAPGAGSGLFSITGRVTSDDNPLADPISVNVTPTAAAALLDPRNDADLGYSAADIFTNVPADLYEIATITLVSDAALATGTYLIGVVDAIWSDADFNEGAIVGSTYSVNVVVPEPGAAGLLLLVGGGMLLRRRSPSA